VIFGGFLAFLLVEWMFDRGSILAAKARVLYGISFKNTWSILFRWMLCLVSAIYYGFKAYRKPRRNRHG